MKKVNTILSLNVTKDNEKILLGRAGMALFLLTVLLISKNDCSLNKCFIGYEHLH